MTAKGRRGIKSAAERRQEAAQAEADAAAAVAAAEAESDGVLGAGSAAPVEKGVGVRGVGERQNRYPVLKPGQRSRLGIRMDPDVRYTLDMYCAGQRINVSDAIEDAVVEYLKTRGVGVMPVVSG